MDERPVAACPQTGSLGELEERVAYVEEAAPMIEATLARASRQLLAEYEAGAVSAAAIAELEQALRDLRGFEEALEVTLG
jgi:hypothetical protein